MKAEIGVEVVKVKLKLFLSMPRGLVRWVEVQLHLFLNSELNGGE
jgi:hypothetical protein